jgi:ADP-heptose:LPS heptosyltransferase
MKINSIRKADYWFGVPACFVLSLIYKIQKMFIHKESEANVPKKIMFLELSEMGSAILAYSAIEEVKKSYPGAKLYFWIFKKNQDSVRMLNIMPKENIIIMRDENFLLLLTDLIKNLRWIWKEHIDVIIDMELFSRFSSILSFLSGAKTRVGFWKFTLEGLYRGNIHTHKVMYNPYIHISKNFLSLAQSLKSSPEEIPLLKMSLENCITTVAKIKSSNEAVENIWQELKEINKQICEQNKIVILNPGVNEVLPLRRWPIENYIGLTKRLLIDPKVFVVIIGVGSQSPDEKTICQQISNQRFINFMGKTTVQKLIDLYNISTLLISHDSGATNLATLTSINIVVLFGPETPILYAPLAPNKLVLYSNLACSPCITAYNHRRSVCKDNKCLKGITVEQVYDSAKNFI